MNPTDESAPTAMTTDEEKIRKVYVKDLKAGETVHTVFKAVSKEKHTSRSGKSWLAVTLTDRTGAVDARVFENVDAADSAFAIGDYLLLNGRAGTFHGKLQLIIDRLERLDPSPIEPSEFQFVAPPSPPALSREAREVREEREPHEGARDEGAPSHKAARQRLLRLLDNPQLTHGLDLLLRHLEALIDERVALKLSGAAPRVVRPEAGERHERKPRGPRVEHKTRTEHEGHHPEAKAHGGKAEAKPEFKRDPTLPSGLAFKPLDQLIPEATPTEVETATAASPSPRPSQPTNAG